MLIFFGWVRSNTLGKALQKGTLEYIGSIQKMLESALGTHKNSSPSNKAYPIDNMNRGIRVRN